MKGKWMKMGIVACLLIVVAASCAPSPTPEVYTPTLSPGTYKNDQGWTVVINFNAGTGIYSWTATREVAVDNIKTPATQTLSGTFKADDTSMTISQENGSAPCVSTQGYYMWSLNESTNTLTINSPGTELEDKCTERLQAILPLDNYKRGEWIKQ
jgi:hypothetical protein